MNKFETKLLLSAILWFGILIVVGGFYVNVNDVIYNESIYIITNSVNTFNKPRIHLFDIYMICIGLFLVLTFINLTVLETFRKCCEVEDIWGQET